MSGTILAGDLFMDRYVNGVRIGERGPINASSFAITLPKSDTKTRKSFMRDNYGASLDSVNLSSGSGSVKIEINDTDPDVLALALLGTTGDSNATSGTVVDEAVVASADLYRKLAHRAISNVVVKDAAGAVTFTNGVDYTVNASAGMVKTLATGLITDGEMLKVSYSYEALTSQRILAAQSNEIRCHIRLDGINLATQKKVEVIIPEAVLVPSGDIGLIGNDFVKYTLGGDIVLRQGEAAPFYYRDIA